VKEIKKQFKPFVNFKKLKKDGFRLISKEENNLLCYLKDNVHANINESGVENLGTDWMLRQMGAGNFKFSRRWAWLYRHYIWASRVKVPRAYVVDIGCDIGEIRNIISKSFYIKNPLYLGIDLDLKRLKKGAEGIQMKVPAMYVQHDVTTKMDFIESNSVDVVFSGETIEHFEKKFAKLMLREIYRILKPGGIFAISTPNKDNSKGYSFHVHEYTIPEFCKMILDAGLGIEKVWGWVTTESCIKKSKKKNVLKIYKILKEKVNKDLVVPMIAYLDPEVSDAFCVEGRKPNLEKSSGKKVV